MTLQIGLLGAVEARLDGAPLVLGGARQRRLLGHLALAPGHVRSFESVAAAVWPDGDAPDDPRQAMRTCVSRLRNAVGADVLVYRDGGYALTINPTVVDVGRFELLVKEASDPGCPRERAVSLLSDGLGLWRGAALEGFESEEWARADAVRLEEIRARAIDDRAEALLALGRPADAIADLEAAIVSAPLREHTHALLMTALHQSGRQAEALRVFQRYRRRMATDLGLEPGAELQRLEAQIAADDAGPNGSSESRPLRGYLLGERIGDGSFAVVYRGTQPSVGRDVAVKVIRSELANRPEFIRRFELEAHLVARLEHPHIVPLYDYWREPGSAYLVMRLLKGGTLDSYIGARRLSADEAIRLAEHVGEALSVAHRAGIVHRDVKPANVFLDGDGHFFLGDFGIAYEAAAPVHATDTLSLGSPAYASPEQLRRQAVGPPADVHGLAITLFESLTGQLPFPEARSQSELLRRQLNDPLPSVNSMRPDLPAGVDAVLTRAAAKDPSERFSSVAEFVSAFTSSIRGVPPMARAGTATVVGELRNPYKGLHAFQEADAADFYGRQRLVDRLMSKLTAAPPTSRFLTVVGPSGSGKSSVVRAGLLPALRNGAVPGSSAWFLTSMTPGAHPFEELEAALNRIATTPTAGLAELMGSDRRGIARAVKQACPVEDAEVVVVLDQFEELFTLCSDDVVRQRFIAGLVDAIADPKSRLRVVATLRADFYDRPLRYPELAPLIEEGAVTVSPLAPDELERAITEPAARVGAAFEPGLVAQMVADVVDQPGALPLLQYSLTELFDANVSGLMTLAIYEDLGGLSGALSRRADQLYEQASSTEQDAARRVFTRLVTLGEGTEDTRRRVRRIEFDAASYGTTDGTTDAGRIIDAYGAARLLAFDRHPLTREPTVEVAHEALIREWPRLRTWLDDDRDGLRVHRHLTDSAAGWEAARRDPGEVYRGGRLEVAEAWAANHSDDLNASEAAFLSQCVEQRRLEEQADQRSRRRIRRALVAVASVAVLAVIAGLLALWQRQDAVDAKDRAGAAAVEADAQRAMADTARATAETERGRATAERDQARIDRLVAESSVELDAHLELSMLLAVEAWKRQPSSATKFAMLSALTHQLSADGTATATAGATAVRRSTSQVLGFIPVPPEPTDLLGLVMSADGRFVALHTGTRLMVFDTTARRMVGNFEVPGYDIEFDLAPDGSTLLTADRFGGELTVIDVASGTRRTAPKQFAVYEGDEYPFLDAVFTQDSDIVVRDGDGRFSMWDLATLQSVTAALPPLATTEGITLRPDGLMVYVTADPDPTLHVWDLGAGVLVRSVGLTPPDRWPYEYVLTDDLSRIVGTAGEDHPLVVWDAVTGELLAAPITPGARTIALDPTDPALLVLGKGSGQILMYDLAEERLVGAPLRERGAVLKWIAVAPDANMMATIADDLNITLWVDSAGQGLLDKPLDPDIYSAAFGGDIVVVRTSEGLKAEIRRADDPGSPGTPLEKPASAVDQVFEVARPSADGSAIVTYTTDPFGDGFTVGVADPVTGAQRWSKDEAPLRSSDWFSVAISDDGSLVALADQPAGADQPGGIEIYDAHTGEALAFVEVVDAAVRGTPVFSPDNRFLDVTTNEGPRRFDISEPSRWCTAEGGPDCAMPFVGLADPIFSQGRLGQIPGTNDVVAAYGFGNGLARWDMSTGRYVAGSPSPDGSNPSEVAISPDGAVAAGLHHFTGNIVLYDTATMEVIGLLPGRRFATVAFAPDGRLVTDGITGQAILWDVDPEHWEAAACHAAGRNLTQEEWKRFVGDDEPYVATCEDWPAGD